MSLWPLKIVVVRKRERERERRVSEYQHDHHHLSCFFHASPYSNTASLTSHRCPQARSNLATTPPSQQDTAGGHTRTKSDKTHDQGHVRHAATRRAEPDDNTPFLFTTFPSLLFSNASLIHLYYFKGLYCNCASFFLRCLFYGSKG